MTNRKIVAFTMSPKQSQFEVDRLEEEAKKQGVEVWRVFYRDLAFDINNRQSRVYVKGEELNELKAMGLWFRVAGTKSGKYTEGRNLAIRILRERVFCVNHEAYLNWARMGKIAQHALFVEQEIPVVDTRIYYTKETIRDNELAEKMGKWIYPVIAKHEKGYQGKSVRKFESWEEENKWVEKINEKNLGMFLWQKCLPTRWDLRVIVLGGVAIGAMKRSAVGKEFRSNFSLGGAVEPWQLSMEEKMLAEKVAKVCGLDYCGVDIMKDNEGNNYILEVNRQCQFKGFEQATGVNVAGKVVEMIRGKAGITD